MSGKYYYFAASLPSLTLDAPPPMTFAQFRRLCTEHVSPDNCRIIDQLGRPPRTGDLPHPFLAAWGNVEIQIRNVSARLRATRLRVDPAPFQAPQEGMDMAIERGVADAFARPTPMDRELALDRLRWQSVSALAGFDPFSGPAIFSYAVRLQIAERWNTMSAEQGGRELDSLVAGLASSRAVAST